MKNVVHLAFGLAVVLLQGALGTLVSLHPFVPNLLLPIVIFLGVDPEVTLLRGAMLSVVLGYFLDQVSAAPVGLHTFVLVATYLAVRGGGLRLLLRGAPFQMTLTFAISLVANGTMLALRAIFQPPEAFPLVMPASGVLGTITGVFTGEHALVGNVVTTMATLIASGLATALVAPLVFDAVRRIDGLTARTRRSTADEGASLP